MRDFIFIRSFKSKAVGENYSFAGSDCLKPEDAFIWLYKGRALLPIRGFKFIFSGNYLESLPVQMSPLKREHITLIKFLEK